MVQSKIIEENEEFRIIQTTIMGYIHTFRIWKNEVCEMKFDDQMAKANGYVNIQDVLNKNPKMKEKLNQIFGSIPEWITIDPEHGFGFPVLNSDLSKN